MAGTVKGKRPISFWPIAAVPQVPQPATYTSPSAGGLAPVQLTPPPFGARFTINGVTIPAESGLHSAQNVVDLVNALTATCGANAQLAADGSLVLNPNVVGGALALGGNATLLTALGLQ